jgi:glycosyltransferase involved in cell wall biosynthesis
MKISLLMTTRKRPEGLKRFFESLKETAADLDNIEAVIRIDNDDKDSKGVIQKQNFETKIIRDKRCRYLGKNWNECWKKATGEIYQLCADDIVYKVKGWDNIVRGYFRNHPDKLIVLYCDDGNSAHGTHPWVHKNWTDVLGYFTQEDAVYGNDTWIREIAMSIKRFVKHDEALINHIHSRFGHTVEDQTFSELRQFRQKVKDGKRYMGTANTRQKHAEKMRRFIDENSMA